MLNPTRFATLALASLVYLAGCAGMAEQEQTKKLEAAVRTYVLSVRWGSYGGAAQYLRHRDGTPIKVDIKSLDDVRVTQYEYAIDAHEPGDTEARMTVAFEYYYVDTSSVRKTYQQSRWWWDPKSEGWFMDGDLPAFPR